MQDRHQDLESENCSQTFAVTSFLLMKYPLEIKDLEEMFLKSSYCAS